MAFFSRRFSRQHHTLTLETSLVPAFLAGAGAIFAVGIGLLLVLWGHQAGWLMVFGLSPLGLVFLYRRVTNYATLTLTSTGCTFRSRTDMYSFRWAEIDRFWVAGNRLSRRQICFTLSPRARAGRIKTGGRTVTPLRDVFIVPTHFGIGYERLQRMLSDWHLRANDPLVPAVGSPHRVV